MERSARGRVSPRLASRLGETGPRRSVSPRLRVRVSERLVHVTSKQPGEETIPHLWFAERAKVHSILRAAAQCFRLVFPCDRSQPARKMHLHDAQKRKLFCVRAGRASMTSAMW